MQNNAECIVDNEACAERYGDRCAEETSAAAKVEGVAGEATSAFEMEPPPHRAEARKEFPPKRYGCNAV